MIYIFTILLVAFIPLSTLARNYNDWEYDRLNYEDYCHADESVGSGNYLINTLLLMGVVLLPFFIYATRKEETQELIKEFAEGCLTTLIFLGIIISIIKSFLE